MLVSVNALFLPFLLALNKHFLCNKENFYDLQKTWFTVNNFISF